MYRILPLVIFLISLFILSSSKQVSAQLPRPWTFECGSAYTQGNCTNNLVGIDCGPGSSSGVDCCSYQAQLISDIEGATVNSTCTDICGVIPGNLTCPRDGTNSCVGSTCSGTNAFCCNYAYAQCESTPFIQCNYTNPDVFTAQGSWTANILNGHYLLRACPRKANLTWDPDNPDPGQPCDSAPLTTSSISNITLTNSRFAFYKLFVRTADTTDKCTAPGIWSAGAICPVPTPTPNTHPLIFYPNLT